MTPEQCRKFMTAVEAADMRSYEFDCDTGTRYLHDGKTTITKVDYKDNQVVCFRNMGTYGGATRQYEANVEIICSNFDDIHAVRTAGSYEQVKKFIESAGLDLSNDEMKVILTIDKHNVDIKPVTGDYVNGFKYLSKREYSELSDKDKKEYDAKKEAYEKVKANYIGKNKAAQITL